MKKNLGLLVMALTVSSASFAEKASTGFYMGVYGGANFNAANITQAANNTALLTGDLSLFTAASTIGPDAGLPAANQAGIRLANLKGKGTASSTAKGVPALGIMVGYSYGFGSCAVLGFEGFMGFDGTNQTFVEYTSGNDFYRLKGKRGLNYGAKILIGFLVTPSTQVHLTLGMDGGAFKYKNEISDGLKTAGYTNIWNITTAIPAASPILYSAPATDIAAGGNAKVKGQGLVALSETKSRAINFAVGAGMRTFIQKNVFVDVSYTYVFGNKTTLTATGNGTLSVAGAAGAAIDLATAGTTGVNLSTGTATSGGNHNPGVEFKNNQHRVTVTLGYKF